MATRTGRSATKRSTASRTPRSGKKADGSGSERPEQKLTRVLQAAAELMAGQGYDQTTIRDVSRETGISLAGLYYYFKSKEDLLYQIQHRTFSSLLERQEHAVAEGGDPEKLFRRLVENQLSFFTENMNEMKLCTFELQSLKGETYDTIEKLRRRYFKIVIQVVQDLMGGGSDAAVPDRVVRHNTLFAFGMLSWTFMWFDPDRDGPVEELSREMVDLVLPGLRVRPGTRR